MFVNDEDDKTLKRILTQYQIPFPDESEINKTVECVENFLPVSKKELRRQKIMKLIRNTSIGFNNMNKSFFVISILLYAAGYFYSINSNIYVYTVLFLIAPIPIIVSLLNVFRGRDENVYEIELTCKISPQEIAVSKVLIVCVFNTILNFALSLFLFDFSPDLVFWKVTMLWLIPMTITGTAALFLCSKIKSIFAVSGTLAVWVTAASMLSVEIQRYQLLNKMRPMSCLVVVALGTAAFILTIKKITDRYYFERGTNYEIDNRKPFKTI